MALSVSITSFSGSDIVDEQIKVSVNVENLDANTETIKEIVIQARTSADGIAVPVLYGKPAIFPGVNDTIAGGATATYITNIVALAQAGLGIVNGNFDLDITASVLSASGVLTLSSATPASIGNEGAVKAFYIDPPSLLVTQNVTPNNILTVAGKTANQVYNQMFRHMAVFNSGKVYDATNLSTWTSDTTGKVTVANTPAEPLTNTDPGSGSYLVGCKLNSKGAATFVLSGGIPQAGTITLSAEIPTVTTTTAVVKIQAPQLVDMWIQGQPGVSVFKGFTIQLTAWGRYSDGSVADVTSTSTWTSSNTSLATVSGGLVSATVANSATQGQLEVSAVSGTQRASLRVTVYPV